MDIAYRYCSRKTNTSWGAPPEVARLSVRVLPSLEVRRSKIDVPWEPLAVVRRCRSSTVKVSGGLSEGFPSAEPSVSQYTLLPADSIV